jgi:hypothetical protein
MTSLLDKAIAEVAKLPEEEQNEVAAWILEELESEHRWQKSFDDSQDMLAKLADEALAEMEAGQAIELNPDDL